MRMLVTWQDGQPTNRLPHLGRAWQHYENRSD
jgi:hypothetical protein